MQLECKYCGAPLKASYKRRRRRELIKSPRPWKMIVCRLCGKKNFIKL